jgi:hypothetical protein
MPVPAGSGLERRSMGIIGDRESHRSLERNEDSGAVEPQFRSEVLRHPFGFLQAAFSSAAKLSNTRSVEGMDAVDLTMDGVVYTLFVDGGTKLPSRIVSTVHRGVQGDVAIETAFPAYKTVHGYKLPSRIVTKIGPRVVEDLRVDQQVASADAVDLRAPGAL